MITGKTHQIRAHLSSIGYPLLGDMKYGSKSEIFNKYSKGQLLHSYRILFPETELCSDISGKEFIAPEPEFFLKLITEMNAEGKKE